jgi:hypothetical protein
MPKSSRRLTPLSLFQRRVLEGDFGQLPGRFGRHRRAAHEARGSARARHRFARRPLAAPGRRSACGRHRGRHEAGRTCDRLVRDGAKGLPQSRASHRRELPALGQSMLSSFSAAVNSSLTLLLATPCQRVRQTILHDPADLPAITAAIEECFPPPVAVPASSPGGEARLDGSPGALILRATCFSLAKDAAIAALAPGEGCVHPTTSGLGPRRRWR